MCVSCLENQWVLMRKEHTHSLLSDTHSHKDTHKLTYSVCHCHTHTYIMPLMLPYSHAPLSSSDPVTYNPMHVGFCAHTQPMAPHSHTFTHVFIYNHSAHTSYARSYTLLCPNIHMQIHRHSCSLHNSHSHLDALIHTYLQSYSSLHSHTYSHTHTHALTRQSPGRN